MIVRLVYSRIKQNADLLFVLTASVIWGAAIFLPVLRDYFSITGDVRTHYWMFGFQDQALFVEDHLAIMRDLRIIYIFGHRIILYPVSFGFGLLYYAASFFINPVIFSKILIFLLLPFSVALLYKLGDEVIGSRVTGLTLSLTFLYFNLTASESLSVGIGLERAFAFPILIAFIYFFEHKKYRLAAAMIPVSALFYIPCTLLIAGTYFLLLSEIQNQRLRIKSGEIRRAFIMGILLTLPLAGWVIIEKFDLAADQASPTFRYGMERTKYLMRGFPIKGRTSLFTKTFDLLDFLNLLGISILTIFMVQGNKVRRTLLSVRYLLVAGMIFYFVSLFVIIFLHSNLLYLPSRYARLSLWLWAVFFVGVNINSLLEEIKNSIKENKRIVGMAALVVMFILIVGGVFFRTSVKIGSLLVSEPITFLLIAYSLYTLWKKGESKYIGLGKRIFFILVLVFGLFSGVVLSRSLGYAHTLVKPSEIQRDLYNYITTLPKDALFSGSPDELDNIPSFGMRRVLFRGHHTAWDAPVIDAFKAYYADDAAEIASFCDKYQVDYLVYDQLEFSEEYISEGSFFFEPYSTEIQGFVKPGQKFALLDLPTEYSSGPLHVVNCGDLLQ